MNAGADGIDPLRPLERMPCRYENIVEGAIGCNRLRGRSFSSESVGAC